MSGYGSLVLGIAGGVVGAFFGNPFIGYAIGSAIGGALFPTKLPDQNVEGPRLGDLRVQTSGYGQMVPIAYGMVRIAGTLIWATPRKPTAHTTSQTSGGGKGGGSSQTVTQTNYTYSISFAIALCKGEIVAIRRVWGNGELVANFDAAADPATHQASQTFAQNMTVYVGDQIQTPDPLIVATEGSSPAYRGVAYVVFSDLQLERFGNNMPNLEFEVLTAGSVGAANQTLIYLDTASEFGLGANGSITPDGNLIIWYWHTQSSGAPTSTGTTLALLDPFTLDVIQTYDPHPWTPGDTPFNEAPAMNSSGDIMWLGVARGVFVWPAGSTPVQIGADAGTRITVDEAGNFYVGFRNMAASAYLLARVVPGASTYTAIRSYSSASSNQTTDLFDGRDGHLYLSRGTSTGIIEKIRRSDGAVIATFNPSVPPHSLCVAGDGSIWYLAGSTPQLWRVAPDLSTEAQVFVAGGSYTGSESERLGRDWGAGDVLYGGPGGFRRYEANGTLGSVTDGVTIDTPSGVRVVCVMTDPAFTGRAYGFNNVGSLGGPSQYISALQGDGVTVGEVTLDEVVTDLTGRVGLEPADIDVSSLASDVVRGYVIANRDSARSALLPLMTAYFCDMVESMNKLTWVKRGGLTVATITQDDMGAHLADSDPIDPYQITRQQEPELPREIALNYLDADRAYQTGTQYARRQVVRSVNDVSYNMAIVLTATEAKRIVDAMLYEVWAARVKISVPLSQKHARLEPTDIVNLELDEGNFTVRIMAKAEGQGIVQLDTMVLDASIYTQPAVGFGGPGDNVTVIGNVPTSLVLLDTALLRENDDTYGFYSSAGGTTGWPGGRLYKSTDGGTIYEDTGTAFSVPGALGYAGSVLPDFAGGNVFDRNSTVDVTLQSGELFSTTEALVLGGANTFWMGGEIGQFMTKTQLSANVYRLSNLLRGRFGTEWAMGRHVASETFALLDTATVQNILAPSSEVGILRLYKGVTFGTLVAAASAKDFTLAANRLKPLSPVHIGGGRNAAGDLTINWKRRARKNTSWPNSVEVPLDEPTEAYEIDVFAGTGLTLTGVTMASPAVLTTSGAHGLSANDVVYILGIVGPIALNEREFIVASVPSTTTFTVRDSASFYPEDASIYPAWSSGGVVYKRGRTLTASTTTISYSAANQTTDYGGTQALVYVSAYQMSSRVGRGYAGTGAV